MNDHYTNSGPGEQNIAQGDHAIGKQENTTQPVSGDGNIFSATGNVTVNQGLRVKTRTVLLGAGLVVVVLGSGGVSWYWLVPPSQAPVINTMGGNVTVIYVVSNNTNTQEIFAQYSKASTATMTGQAVTVFYDQREGNLQKKAETFNEVVKELGITDSALSSFYKILEEQQVPRNDWDNKLRELAKHYKELLSRIDSVQAADPQVAKLEVEAKQAIEAGDYANAEHLLNHIEEKLHEQVGKLTEQVQQRRISAAATTADQARLQEVQFSYEKAAMYWQKAATLMPEERKKERADYLNNAGYNFQRIANYIKAQLMFEQSLAVRQHSDKIGRSATLNNISSIYWMQGDYTTALKYLAQSLEISRELGEKEGEGTTLNNIGQIYDAQGDYATALKYLEQSLAIRRELGDKAGETVTSWNIGLIYKKQDDLKQAEQHISRAVQLADEIGHPSREEYREALADIRAKLRGR